MASFSTRVCVFICGCFALAWSVYSFTLFAREAPLENVVRRIIAREAFRNDVIASFEKEGSQQRPNEWQRAAGLFSRAVIDVRLVEKAFERGDLKHLDDLLLRSEVSIRSSLSVAPADPFLWAVYFWIENTKDGFRRSNLSYLSMSYKTGPNEGWVAVTRSRFALALFRSLTPELAEDAVGEFSHLVASRFYNETISQLSRSGPDLSDRLLKSLGGIEMDDREAFAKAAYKRGFDWKVPGVEKPEWRPWH